jgi:hypothetical protein
MPVVSVKVEEKMKKDMEKLRSQIDWPKEIRDFIGGRIGQVERETNLKQIERMLRGIPRVPRGTATQLVREDRDTSH